MIRYNWQDEFVVSELWPNLVTIHYANLRSLSWERGLKSRDSSFCFPRISRGSRESKLTVSQGTSDLLHILAGTFEAGNSLNLFVTALVNQHLRVTVHCYPLTS